MMHIVLFRRKWFTTAGCLCAAAAILWAVNHPAVLGTAAHPKALPIYSVAVPGAKKLAAITFDAAWDDV